MIASASPDRGPPLRFLGVLVAVLSILVTPLAPHDAHAQMAAPWTQMQCDTLVEAAGNVRDIGLPPRQALIDRPAELDRQITSEFDLDEIAFLREERSRACDALFLSLVQDHLAGRTIPTLSEPSWHIAPPPYDIEALRYRAQTSPDLAAFLDALGPQDLEYRLMREALAGLGASPGSESPDAPQRAALVASLERRRWAQHAWSQRQIVIDVPFFDARLTENGRTMDRWTVIVGAPRTPTPSFAAQIVGVTLNPSWTPPAHIVRNEILPMLRRNPGLAETLGYFALDASGSPIDADWNEQPFPYRVIQAPGPRNALGQVKVEMPNPYAVYLHDTANRELFTQDVRAFSHGCIRVEDPRRLALALIGGPNLDQAALDAAIAANTSQYLPLAAPLQVVVLYRTVRLGEDGALQFAADIYGRDRRLARAIEDGQVYAFGVADRPPTECAESPR